MSAGLHLGHQALDMETQSRLVLKMLQCFNSSDHGSSVF